MRPKTFTCLIAASLWTAAHAAAPSDAPPGSNGMCNDGTYSSAAEKRGACRGHKGVKEWYREASTGGSPAAAAASAASPSPTHPSTSVAGPAAAPERGTASRSGAAVTTTPAAGGGPGKVWANTSTKVYHCSGAKFYGTTKHGEYMSEADAKAKGFHADHGKACT